VNLQRKNEMAFKVFFLSPTGSFFTQELVKFLGAEEITLEQKPSATADEILESSCDIILYDLAVGAEVCLNLSNKLLLEKGGARPVSIAFARQHEEEFLIDALSKGIDDVLIKPVNLKHLMARLKNLMDRRVKTGSDGIGAMVNCFDAPAVITDGALVISCCNKQACEVFGEGLVGKKISTLFPRETAGAMEQQIEGGGQTLSAIPTVIDTVGGNEKRVVVSTAKIDKWEVDEHKYMFVISEPIANFEITET
jgi:DNA-binding response OmpR family regulator